MIVYKYLELKTPEAEEMIGKRVNIEGKYYYISDAYQAWADGSPLCQEGICWNCKTRLISWSKDCECPKCQKQNYLT